MPSIRPTDPTVAFPFENLSKFTFPIISPNHNASPNKNINIREIMAKNGNSLFNIDCFTLMLAKRAVTPKTIKRLNVFEPSTLLTAIALEPFAEANALTASSGSDVPTATIVSPTTIDGTFNLLATATLPSTKKSAPLIRNKNMLKKIVNIRLSAANWLILSFLTVLATACSISYKFNGASIDYTKVKTITIRDFTNQAPYVNPTLAPQFTEDLKDIYIRQTRLQLVPSNGDLELEGEITGYDFAPMAVKEDAIASQTRLTITVRVRYSNRVNPDEDFEQSFSAYREFDSNLMPQQVEGTLCEEIIEEIVDQIYNATVANW